MNELPKPPSQIINNELNDICLVIREKISKQENQELFHEIEDSIRDACTVYLNKWKPYIEDFKNMTNKECFISETRTMFSTLYLHYATEDMLKEVDNIIKNEPDEKYEAEQFLEFIECLKSIQCIEEKDIEDLHSEKLQQMKKASQYLEKKNNDMIELNNTMKKMNNTLEKLTTTLENFVECNKTLNRIECLENDLNTKKND